MIISLIGMSNSGKTYWAKKLETIGFLRLSCDDYIEKKLDKELKTMGYSGIHDVSKWMGQPYEEKYLQTSKKYLDFEIESLCEIIRKLKSGSIGQNIVVDTTGSVIYTGDKIMEELARLSKILYLDTPPEIKKKMYEIYFRNPKPVIWGDSFKRTNGESDLEVLKICYPNLLEFRSNKYKKYANITLNYFLLRKRNLTANDFLKFIQNN